MKTMDINYARREENECDSEELLMCIQAWHEMLNPGHHYLELYSDGSGEVIAAKNYPSMYLFSKDERKPLAKFSSLTDFIKQTRTRLESEGWEIVDSR
jgi:hypothetical protein